MMRIVLKSKIHRARVTEANLEYEGSITIDSALMLAADIWPGEKVEVLNLNTGQRLETYAIKGPADSGVICLNGPAARGACVGDEVIVLSYYLAEEKDAKVVTPKVVKVNAQNRMQG